ncbi:MAG: DUF1016 domain-containing protein [bacterium]|nr:DUF1016 domain-containing protein [bacterium]
MSELTLNTLYSSIKHIIETARHNVRREVNRTMVDTYWQIGKLLITEEQKGKQRAEYGKQLIKEISRKLAAEFGKGFFAQSLWNMRRFYQKFSSMRRELQVEEGGEILSALRRELSWTHYKVLLRVEKPEACVWYMNEAANQNWPARALERQINSLYHDRLLISRDKKPVQEEAKIKTSTLQSKPEDFMKNPYVLEFLNIKDRSHYRESELEQAIIEKVQEFLLELGKGFAFVSRQKRISTETKDFYIDLVFYNYHLKCFVLIDLKTGELTHQDVGQMDMYVRMFDDLQKGEDDNPTVGLILCTDKDKAIAKYSILKENKQLFASKYLLYLPSEEELAREMEREKWMLEKAMEDSRSPLNK